FTSQLRGRMISEMLRLFFSGQSSNSSTGALTIEREQPVISLDMGRIVFFCIIGFLIVGFFCVCWCYCMKGRKERASLSQHAEPFEMQSLARSSSTPILIDADTTKKIMHLRSSL